MDLKKINKQLVTFSSLALLFLGSLFYLASVAFDNKSALREKQESNIAEYKDILE